MVKKFLKRIEKFVNKHKRLSRILLYIFSGIIIFLLVSELSLRYILPTERVKHFIIAKVSQATTAELRLGKITGGLYGVDIRDVQVLSEGEELASVGRVTVRLSLHMLFKGQLKARQIIVRDAELKIVKNPDGSFNFDKIIPPSSPAPEEEKKNGKINLPNIFLQTVRISGGNISYADAAQKLFVLINDLSVDADNINIKKPFRFSVNADLNLNAGDISLPVKAGLTIEPNLAKGDFDKAYADIKTAVINVNGSALAFIGRIENFNNPSLKFNSDIRRLDSLSFDAVYSGPEINLSSLYIEGAALADLQNGKIDINSFYLSTAASSMAARGFLVLGETPEYKIETDGAFTFAKLPEIMPLLAEHNPEGRADWALTLRNNNAAGFLRVEEAGGIIPSAGLLKDLNTEIDIKSLKEIHMPRLKGFLNGHPFYAKFNYKLTPGQGSISAAFDAERLYLKEGPSKPAAKSAPAPEEENAAAPETLKETQEKLAQKLNLPPFRALAHVDIRSFDGPYFKADKLKFDADVQNITPMLDGLQGSVLFSSAEGQIKDINQLTEANVLTKTLFMSLGIVSRVINTLNVLDVLKGIGAAMSPSGEYEGETNPRPDGKVDFDSFVTEMDFEEGVSEIKQGSFVSPLLSFKLAGQMDFNSRNLDMTVNAAPGKHQEKGIMPLTIKIGGTLDAPEGKMSVVSSVASLFTQTLLNNPAMNALKSGAIAVTGAGKEDAPAPQTFDGEEYDYAEDSTGQD